MYLILRYHDDSRVDAILLAANRGRMRVVIRGCDDTVEFRNKNKNWVAADGSAVEIESVSGGMPNLANFHLPRVAHAA
jgi:hypothetical protein